MVDTLGELCAPTPRLNPDLKGQAGAEREFFEEFGGGQFHHAWMICGPKGIGKATFAYRAARYVLSQTSFLKDAPVQSLSLFVDDLTQASTEFNATMFLEPLHPVFRRVASGTHADFLSVERSVDEKTKRLRKEIIVDDVRAIKSFLNKTPSESDWRIVLVDAADEMTISAENALLKVLEEPPARALILLVSHNPSSLMATTRSRCRQLFLKPLNASVLKSIFQVSNPDISNDELKTLLAISNGSIGLALKLLEHDGLGILKSANILFANLSTLNISDLANFCDKITKNMSSDAYLIFCLILNYWLAETIKAKAVLGAQHQSEIYKWIDIKEEVNILFNKAEDVNLDTKQVVLNALFAIAGVE